MKSFGFHLSLLPLDRNQMAVLPLFPKIVGIAFANEMLLSGQKLTAKKACGKGLVAQVFWPGIFTQEVMVRIKELAHVFQLCLRNPKPCVLQHEDGVGTGQREGVQNAEENLGLGPTVGLHVKVLVEEN
ncbi:hypothetical protein P7K49_031540 [Saguinus oedipus]|uniref:Uncharacterized protein n=1 Tax=Saguinus oedipus TaxID=9490 RepID=A0ABQ9TZQ0_SAGOE|nr:hypothetical protein P7K49_031540 [Saguinus oedipus]